MNRRLTEQDGAGGGGLLGGSGAMRSRRATEQDAGAFSGMGGGAMRSRRGTEQDGAFAGLGGGPGGRSGSRRGTEQDGGFEDFDAMCNQAAEAKQQQQQQAGFSSFIDRSQGSRTLQRMLSGIGEDSRGSTPSAVSNAAASMRNHAAIRRNSTLEGVEVSVGAVGAPCCSLQLQGRCLESSRELFSGLLPAQSPLLAAASPMA